MSISYLSSSIAPPTQREPLQGQVMNNAGGFVYAIDDWARVDRFLILGSEGGTYYATERTLSRDNAQVIEKLAATDGVKLVARIVEISTSGRAPKNDPATLALALVARKGPPIAREAAYAALPAVCRIGTHLYHFVQFATQMGGWGRGLRRAVAAWFNAKPAEDVAMQLAKYQSRDGWSARDLLRLSHAKPSSIEHNALYQWATSGYDDVAAGENLDHLSPFIGAVEELKSATSMSASLARVVDLITQYKVPRECIPTEWLTKPEVWAALLPHMGMTAMIRNLATMTKIGLIAPLSDASREVVARLRNADLLRKARVHPMAIMIAMKTYESGHSARGNATWAPLQPVVDALDAAFYASFKNVKPSGKATLLALDVSGSMNCGDIAGTIGITPRIASAAMALVTAAVEPNHHIVGFSHSLVDVPISPNMRLTDAIRTIERIRYGATDCGLPITWATKSLRSVEAFSVYTDNETYAGPVHPSHALAIHRQKTGVFAKLAVVGLTETEFSIANPTDPGMMDFVGFDAAAPAIMSDFFRGSAEDHGSVDTSEVLSE